MVLAELSSRQLLVGECSYSAVTRIELLGFHGITTEEESTIVRKLESLTYFSLTRDVEDKAIELRRLHKIKLPDAIVAATALCQGVELLTMDQHLLAIMRLVHEPK